ncbi:MAG: cell division FtsA domain-containing protein, partial [Lachnospiraceae bacterium]
LEDIYTLKSMAVQKAYDEFGEENQDGISFYCVGNTVIHYYMNDYQITNPEGHKASSIGADLIATFLPDDVIDGLYKAVEIAGLHVANLTLEPIAAIQVAIPEKYRMLNLALIDVGAGTSDICITDDGSIVAYGMIPSAGDGLTEVIAKHCLVDFDGAEAIKRQLGEKDEIEYEDIMGLPMTISSKEMLEVLDEPIRALADAAAEKILELNGDKPVSAVFVVGGGGKIPGYTDLVAEKLGIPKQRSAIRGKEVMGNIIFEEEVTKDSTLVTPLGICLNYYEQSNNFIIVTFNDKRIKLYDNDKLSVVDAALQADFPNEKLFPRRGKTLHFTVNKKARSVKGQLGDAALITLGGREANIYTPIHENEIIKITESSEGAPGAMTIGGLPEFRDIISVQVQDKRLNVPKYAKVNGIFQSSYYDIQDGDDIEVLDYCTVGQLLEFMDVLVPEDQEILVNHKPADRETKVYENYLVSFQMKEQQEQIEDEESEGENLKFRSPEAINPETEGMEADDSEADGENGSDQESSNVEMKARPNHSFTVLVNGKPVLLTGKPEYVYVDVFDRIDFDLSKPQGKGVVTKLNGRDAQYMEPLLENDVLEIYWEKDE